MCGIVMLSESTVTTRKAHACTWCGQFIPKGAKVDTESLISEGQMSRQWWHPECREAFEKTEWGDPYDICWMQGEFGRGETPEGLYN